MQPLSNLNHSHWSLGLWNDKEMMKLGESWKKRRQFQGSTYPHYKNIACPRATSSRLHSMCSENSAITSSLLFLLLLVFNTILGFLMNNLNLRSMSALFSFLFFFFSFLFALYSVLICRERVLFMLFFNLTCYLNISFSSLIYLFSISNS